MRNSLIVAENESRVIGVRRNGIRYRALRPWSDEDRALLAAVSRGQYVTDGFTNRNVAGHLYPCRDADKKQRCRIASRVSYRLRLLRTHGLVRKVKSRRRYHVTPKGRTASLPRNAQRPQNHQCRSRGASRNLTAT
ncbi:MAG: hypothetical protein ACYTG0_40320 [Planctomycetota bacterium]|jgi:hypothetical protein